MAAGASALEGIYQFDVEDKVTDVGLRLSIAKELPDELELRVDNIAANKVRVYLKGNEAAVKRFYERLKKAPLGDAEHYQFSDLKPLEAPGCFNVESDRFFHKLQCEQMGKFVGVGLDMGRKIDGMSGKIDGMSGKVDIMTHAINEMNKKMDDLPERIAKALRNIR